MTITPLLSTTIAASDGARHADSSASTLTLTAADAYRLRAIAHRAREIKTGHARVGADAEKRPEPCASASLKYGRYETLVPTKLTGRFQLLAEMTKPCRSMTSTATLPASRFTAPR